MSDTFIQSNALQQNLLVAKTLNQVLENDVGVQQYLGIPARLYDALPKDPIYPYLTYGRVRLSDVGGDDKVLVSHIMDLHVWSRYEGRAEIINCLGAINNALSVAKSHGEMTHVVNLYPVYTDYFRAPDGYTLHGLIRLRIISELSIAPTEPSSSSLSSPISSSEISL